MNVESLAEERYGVVTRAQGLACGLSASAIDRRVARGRWLVCWPGVYRISGSPATGRQRAIAATFWAGKTAVVSHTTAARLLRIGGISFRGLDLTVPRRSGVRTNQLRIHHAELSRPERVTVDGIPCTSATRTLIDCAPSIDGETLETAFEQARRMGLTSIAAVHGRLGRGRPGSALMREVLRHAEARPKESRRAWTRRGERRRKPKRTRRSGERPRAGYPGARSERDPATWHGNRLQWKRDRRRVAAIEAQGWRIVHVTWDDVTKHPIETLDRLALALRAAA
jgi:hypothetical protein